MPNGLHGFESLSIEAVVLTSPRFIVGGGRGDHPMARESMRSICRHYLFFMVVDVLTIAQLLGVGSHVRYIFWRLETAG